MNGSASQHRPLRLGALARIVILLLLAAGLVPAQAAAMGVDTTGAPTITSDRADYSPGDAVVLSGANWQPGEVVHLFVDDEDGHMWSRSVDVTADSSGLISDEFSLPSSFVSLYSVTATADSGTARTTFTDGNVKFDVSPTTATAQFVETLFATSSACTGTAKGGFPKTVVAVSGDNLGVGSSESLRLDASATSTQGGAFVGWTSSDSPASPFTAIPGTGGKSICIPGFQSGTNRYVATYAAANAAPTVGTVTGSTTVSEGALGTYGVSATDPDGDSLTYAWSVLSGNAAISGLAAGSSVSVSFSDGPSTVSLQVIVNDGNGHPVTRTLSITENNVAPAVTLTSAPTAANEGEVKTFAFSVSDPGADTFSVAAGSPGCGVNGVLVAGSLTTSAAGGSFQCRFPDGPASSTVSIVVTDSDGAASSAATAIVAVANVAPTVVLSGALSANEGDTKTYSYTVTDPGVDTFSVAAGSPGCAVNGVLVAGSVTTSAAGGSFQCRFPDGPASSTVSIVVTDSDGAASSAATAIVAIANVAPAVTLTSAPTAANEGEVKTFAFSVSDPGVDTFSVAAGSPGCGVNGVLVAGSVTTSAAGGSFQCRFPDGPASSTVSIVVTDSDGAASSAATAIVAIANVAPTVVLSGAVSANEGGTKTYSYTVTDPGADT